MRREIKGFSLLEVLVAMLLVGLILSLSVKLLREVHLTSVEVQRTLPDSVPQLAVQLLRHDILRSSGTETPPGSGPLGLRLPDGSRIDYDESLGSLTRTVIAADGTLQGQRVILRGVTRWDWHDTLAPGLLEVRIVYRRHGDPGLPRRAGVAALHSRRSALQSLTVRFAQRARFGRRVF